MKDLDSLIKQTAGISAYKIVTNTKRTAELYFVKRKLETVRATDTESSSVTVFVRHDDALGDSTFPVFASMDEDAIRKALALAVERANLVSNKPYDLPKGGVETHEIPSDFADRDLKEVAGKVAEAVFDVPVGEGGSINALEIFVTQLINRVRTGEGLDKTQVSHRIAIEAIPTNTDDKESVELYEWYELSDLDPERIKVEIADKMREVKARKEAVKGEPMTINVALRAQEIGELADELSYELTYASVFQHSNAFELGDNLQKNRSGDPLSVTRKGALKGSRYAAVFDQDGTTLKDCTVIEDGKAAALWGSTRYGQYLGRKPEEISGNLDCVAVSPGSLDGIEGDYLECVSMSGMQLDVYNDYIGGEIRLAYLHQGGKVTPVTGISMSAKLSDVLPSIRLSNDQVVRGYYQGPSLALLKDVQIV